MLGPKINSFCSKVKLITMNLIAKGFVYIKKQLKYLGSNRKYQALQETNSMLIWHIIVYFHK